MSLLVVGSVALDDVESPAGSVRGALGGAACYFAVAARPFVPVRTVGVVGEDFPQEHLDFLAERGIDVSGIERRSGPSFRWGGRYHESLNERDTLFTELGVFADFEPALPDDYRDSEYVFLANIHPGLQQRVLDQAARRRFVAMDTMNYWIEGTPDELRHTLARVDALVINDEEARLLTGTTNLVRASQDIRDMGPETVIIKRGEYGALLFDSHGVFAAPAFPLEEVRDPTGAGDSFAGGMMGAIALARSTGPEVLRRAVIYGSAMASFCVERFSLDRLREVGMEEIEARFDAFRTLTRF